MASVAEVTMSRIQTLLSEDTGGGDGLWAADVSRTGVSVW